MSSERPFIPVCAPVVGQREVDLVTQAVRSGWVSSIGEFIDRFEKEFAAYVGVKHAIALSNGTVALHLALHAMGVGPGDEVILPDLTFAATAHTVLQTGATPVFVDVEADTWCMDPDAVARALTPRTRVIAPVHLYGHPADMGRLLDLASSRCIAVLEDAAEAHGATIGGKKVGSFGRLSAFSFYGNKIITTGEGGMLTTDDDDLATRCRFLKDHGMSPTRRYYHTEVAFNYRMTNLQAALGVAQLEQIEAFIARKRAVQSAYAGALEGLPRVTTNIERPGCRSVYWMASVVLPEGGRDRESICRELRTLGVDTRPFFVPMSQLPHLSTYRAVGVRDEGCVVARRLGASGLNLPSGCGLSENDVGRVVDALRTVLR